MLVNKPVNEMFVARITCNMTQEQQAFWFCKFNQYNLRLIWRRTLGDQITGGFRV